MNTILLDADTCRALCHTQATTYQGRQLGARDCLPVTDSVAKFEQGVPDFCSPWWVHRQPAADRFVGICWVAPELTLFDAHFPDNPLLPGVVQVDWAVEAACQVFADLQNLTFAGMSRIKFKSPVLPGAWLQLTLQLTLEKGVLPSGAQPSGAQIESAAQTENAAKSERAAAAINFEFACGERVATQGRFRFAA